MRNIVDIFKDVVEGLTQEIVVNSVTVGVGTFTFNVSKTYWARPQSQNSLATKVTINSVVYNITSLVYNTSITVTTATDLSGTTSLTIAAPIYVNGTQLATQSKRRNKNSSVQCPFVWLVEPFVSIENKSRLSIIEATPELTILFLDNANTQDWVTTDHYTNVINPMNELADAFELKLRNTRSIFGRVTSWRKINHANFGSESTNGHLQSILNERTSGVEVRFSVEILKCLRCNGC